MAELHLSVESAEHVRFTAAPLLTFKLRVSNTPAEELVHAAALRAQIQLEVTRRTYSSEEQARLGDLFGTPDRWGQTLRSLLWMHASVMVPRFTGGTIVDGGTHVGTAGAAGATADARPPDAPVGETAPPSSTTQPPMSQVQCSQPLAKGHRPVTR